MDAFSPEEDAILFVGDIQGCLEPLEQLLRRAEYSPDRHRLIPLGDTINRGPDNVGVLALLESLGAEPVLGNHEMKVLEVMATDRGSSWLQRHTVGRDLVHSPRCDAWLDWMRRWPAYYRGDGCIAVHGGLHPRLPLEQTPVSFLVSVRLCDADGNLPVGWDGRNETFPPGFLPWHSFYHGEETVIYGHWARQGLHLTSRTRGLDTGCVYGKQLTALWWGGDRLVQVKGLEGGSAGGPR